MNIKILGSGCSNCRILERRTMKAVEALKIDARIEKVTDFQKIASYGIMRTPGLVIDEKVAISGSVPTVDKIQELLIAHRSA